jgi:peptidoglycan glycosyltransferase
VLVQTAEDGSRTVTDQSLAHVLGYSSFRYGTYGVEEVANAQLMGEAGLSALPAAVQSLLHEERQGGDVRLTIDLKLQRAAAAALGGRAGAIVVLDAHSGAVLAMVSAPAYDPAAIDRDFAALRDDPSRPLLNRATQGLYAPGSIFKTVTLASALQNGVVQPDTPADCPVQIVVQGATVTSRNEPHAGATHDVASAYQWSCNTEFARLGIAVGPAALRATAEGFGFEASIPFDGLPVAVSRLETEPGFLASDEVALASTAFGQGQLLVTPLQMALVAAAAANGGRIPSPYVIQAPLKGLLPWRIAVDGRVAGQVADAMRLSGREGWARGASTPALAVAGKTGTAEAPPGAPHAWYLGFAPAADPRIAFAVVVEHGGDGAGVAAPIVAQMLRALAR